MGAVRKLLHMTLIMFGIIALFCYIGFHLGYEGLLLVGEIDLPYWATIIIGSLLYSANIYLVFSIVLGNYENTVLKRVIPFCVLDTIICLIYPSSVICSITMAGYLLIQAIIKKDKHIAIRLAIVVLLIYSFQSLTYMIKLGYRPITDWAVSEYQALAYSVDMILFLLVIYCIGGERHNGQTLERVIFPEDFEAVKLDQEDLAELEAWNKQQGFKRIKSIALLLGFQVVQWMIILAVCNLGNVLVEGLVITISFVTYGTVVRYKWHSKSLVCCTLASAGMFYAAAQIIPSFGYSQLLPVCVGLILIYCMYRVAVYTDGYKDLKQRIHQIEDAQTAESRPE